MKKKKLPTDEPSIIAGISGIVVLIILVGLLVYCWPAIDTICSAAMVHLNKFVATANAETPNDFDPNDMPWQDYPPEPNLVESWESLAESVGELCEAKSILISAIEKANEFIEYDPNFYSIDDPNIEKVYYLSFDCPDTNSLTDAAKELREYCKWWPENFSNKVPTHIYADLHVKIGNEEHTASFEDFFEWMGFER